MISEKLIKKIDKFKKFQIEVMDFNKYLELETDFKRNSIMFILGEYFKESNPDEYKRMPPIEHSPNECLRMFDASDMESYMGNYKCENNKDNKEVICLLMPQVAIFIFKEEFLVFKEWVNNPMKQSASIPLRRRDKKTGRDLCFDRDVGLDNCFACKFAVVREEILEWSWSLNLKEFEYLSGKVNQVSFD